MVRRCRSKHALDVSDKYQFLMMQAESNNIIQELTKESPKTHSNFLFQRDVDVVRLPHTESWERTRIYLFWTL